MNTHLYTKKYFDTNLIHDYLYNNNVLDTYYAYKEFLKSMGFEKFVVISFDIGKITLLIEHHFFSVKKLHKKINQYKPVNIQVIIEKPKWWEIIKDYI